MSNSDFGESDDKNNGVDNMAKMTARVDRDSTETMAAFGGGTRSGMLTTATSGVGNEEERRRRRGRKMEAQTQNLIPD